MEYTDSDLPSAYTLCQRKLKTLFLATKVYKGIPLYAAKDLVIPRVLQVIHNTGCGVPVHQSPKCVLNCSQRPAGRGCHSLGLKWAFIHSQKEDPLRNLLEYGPVSQEDNMGLPILGVLPQYLGLLVLGLGLLHLSLGFLILRLGLRRHA
ncbi:hypothetical protein DSO57_1009702 [Entomophthora muscae]|uniref:Uncharacterized protein n=1 Tax=Entomophthora muscae TaxID=34485 RepID=A0ACC2UHJ6_9FUNG|nr:hypothetical protein DSO57_1009702 [Entomophthora muscae]